MDSTPNSLCPYRNSFSRKYNLQHLAGTGHKHLVRDYYVQAFRHAVDASLEKSEQVLRRDKGEPMKRLDREALRELEPTLPTGFKAGILIKAQARATSAGPCVSLNHSVIDPDNWSVG